MSKSVFISFFARLGKITILISRKDRPSGWSWSFGWSRSSLAIFDLGSFELDKWSHWEIMILIYDLWSIYWKKDQRSQSKISNVSIILVFFSKNSNFGWISSKILRIDLHFCVMMIFHWVTNDNITKTLILMFDLFEKRSRLKIKDRDQRSWSLISQWSRSIAVIFDLFKFWSRSLVMILIFDLDQIFGDLTQAWCAVSTT